VASAGDAAILQFPLSNFDPRFADRWGFTWPGDGATDTSQDDGTPLTLFIFDSTLPPLQPGNKDRKVLLQLARNALKKLRTIRHPDVCVSCH
jgi:hypothetical protein